MNVTVIETGRLYSTVSHCRILYPLGLLFRATWKSDYAIFIKFVDEFVLNAGPNVCWDAHGQFLPLTTASSSIKNQFRFNRYKHGMTCRRRGTHRLEALEC